MYVDVVYSVACRTLLLTRFLQTFALQLIAFIAEGSWSFETRLVAVHILSDLCALAENTLSAKDFASVVLQLCVHAVTGFKRTEKNQVHCLLFIYYYFLYHLTNYSAGRLARRDSHVHHALVSHRPLARAGG